jgi:hypothetical protein
MAAPYVTGALALLSAARPDMSEAALRGALMASAPKRSILSGLLGGGGLDVGAAMHAILPADRWAAASAPAAAAATAATALRLRTGTRTRSGRRATLRWSATGIDTVARWQVSLDGRRVAVLDGGDSRVVRHRIAAAGNHRWRVVGFDESGAKVVAGVRRFRVLRAR